MSTEEKQKSNQQPDDRQRQKKEESRRRFLQSTGRTNNQSSLADQVIRGNRKALSKAITLVESRKASDQESARQILEACLPHTGQSVRIGVTGVPGVGKSTFIDRLGRLAIDKGHTLAVLTIDPSSSRSGGSILGDKTRMGELSKLDDVFIRPSPTGGSLGGVARKTRETMLLCEAAGYDRIFVETVGVGQSETAVRSMVDCFLLLALPGSGDELQGIKRGIIEMADLIVINKADDPESRPIRDALSTYRSAIQMLPSPVSGHEPQILTCSALNNERIDNVWESIGEFIEVIIDNGYLEEQRRDQLRQWMHETIEQRLKEAFYENRDLKPLIKEAEQSVLEGKKTAFRAAQQLIEQYLSRG